MDEAMHAWDARVDGSDIAADSKTRDRFDFSPVGASQRQMTIKSSGSPLSSTKALFVR